MKLRKNEMKLRKNEIKVPKNFSTPPWRMKSLHRGIPDFLRSWPYAHPSHIPTVRSHSALPPDFPRISETSLLSLVCF